MELVTEIDEFLNFELNLEHECNTEMGIAFILLSECKKKILELKRENDFLKDFFKDKK